jgi:phenylpyruvate tautomerase PptA (4-oxalocrotonate tautomerase family)
MESRKEERKRRRKPMPLWKIYAPAGAYTDDDKRAMSETITDVYAQVPLPKFYVVTIFEEMKDGNCFVGGESNSRFVRFRVDHIARTLPTPTLREWWMHTVHNLLKPWVTDRGFEWEISFEETPVDLWSVQGQLPPPFDSIAETRWVEENRPSPYTFEEKVPVVLPLGPGNTDHRSGPA